MSRPGRPVVRDDGVWFPSQIAAGRAAVRDYMGGVGDPEQAARQINKVCQHYKGAKRTHGHGYEYADSPMARAFLGKIAALQDEAGSLRARLENANDRLREAGLEAQ